MPLDPIPVPRELLERCLLAASARYEETPTSEWWDELERDIRAALDEHKEFDHVN